MAENFDRTAVNYDTVTQAATDVRNTAKNLSDHLDALMRAVKRHAAHWEGEAKTAFSEIERSNTTEMAGLTEKLGRIATLLDESVIGYQDTDKGNAARFRMLMG
ncbi:WXG100 family type VII secretion target [Streptomyces echinoruber]|uniref:ESAT-6-like protein n=1 Tax=Streptomyces echinoruber TaxID=68898 RepID=A0A918RWL6_9ACTN|nr:WXG100 family type VII secretion target [Streptomyces echinoruber]GHA13977.1 ESAT-6-like protein [Streptomyces echinoruber]